MLRNLLVFRLILLNASLAAVCAWAYFQGYLTTLFEGETTGIGYGLVALTLAAIIGVFHRAQKVSAAFDKVKDGVWVDTRKMLIKSAYIGLTATCVMLLGVWANGYGIWHSFTDVNITSTDTILATVSGMWGGLKIAFINTLISIALYLAIMVNYSILVTATRLLMIDASDLKARGDG